MTAVAEPVPVFYDADGTPLEAGMIYVGAANQDARAVPIQVYWDAAFTIAADQPIRTIGGRPSYQGRASNFYVNATEYSIATFDRQGVPVLPSQNASVLSNDTIIVSTRAEIEALDTDLFSAVVLTENPRQGTFFFDASDLSAEVAADPEQGVYIAPAVSPTGSAGAWVREYAGPAYGHWFGAIGDGTITGTGTDDTVALQAWVTFGKTLGIPLALRKAGYRITDDAGLWVGNSVPAAGSFQYLDGNDAVIYIDIEGGVGIDLVGIANSAQFELRNILIETCDGITGLHGIVMGRPARAAGTYSSGKAILDRVFVRGAYHGSCYYNVASESNVLGSVLLDNDIGCPAMWTRFDYFENTFRLPFDAQTAAFTEIPNNILTGGTSGATARILRVGSVTANAGVLFCKMLGGTFEDNEIVTSTNGGSATVNAPSGYYLIPYGAKNFPFDAANITSSFQMIGDGFQTLNRSTEGLFAALTIMSWNDIAIGRANLNMPSYTTGPHAELVEISTCNSSTGVPTPVPPDTGTPTALLSCSGITMVTPYLHATHATSVRIGDPCESGAQNYIGIQIVLPSVAGTVEQRIKCFAGTGTCSLTYPNFDVAGDIDLGGFRVVGGGSRFVLNATTSETLTFTCSGSQIDGVLRCRTTDVVNIASVPVGARNLRIEYDGIGYTTLCGEPESLTIASGAITPNAAMHRLVGEGGTTDTLSTINIPASATINGALLYLRANNVGYLITIDNAGNIVTPGGGNWVLSNTCFTTLQYDDQQDKWCVIAGQPRGAPIADPAGGATVDAEARTAINAILAHLEATGSLQP